jgi:Fe-S-cluster containining protein
VRDIYRDLATRPAERDCRSLAGCCHFRLTGRSPVLTRGEALLAAKGVRAAGRKQLKPHPDGACPALGVDQRCTIYEFRPFGCRTHFCAADLIQRLEALDERLGGDGSRPFEAAVSDALSGAF